MHCLKIVFYHMITVSKALINTFFHFLNSTISELRLFNRQPFNDIDSSRLMGLRLDTYLYLDILIH